MDNVLTNEEISLLYKNVKETKKEQTQVENKLGFKAYFTNFDKIIIDKIQKVVQDNFGEHWQIKNVMFAQYSNEWGYKPRLHPHFDDAFNDHKLTFDLRLNGNVDWNIVVEDRPFLLKYNQALMFSGTDQIHWREKINFSNDSFLDLIFCHFSMKDSENWVIDSDWKLKMKEKELMWQNKLDYFPKIETVN
jgi:hypothetical protein